MDINTLNGMKKKPSENTLFSQTNQLKANNYYNNQINTNRVENTKTNNLTKQNKGNNLPLN
jgi:hypothetical protein